MRFGIDVAQQRMSWDEVVRRVRLAEDLGFEGAWGFDHFQPMYGEGPGECFEGMTTLAALAGQTSRIRLGLLVTGMTYRHPSVFAAQALTIDHASHGRLDLSLGAAWFDPEHDALGIPFPVTSDRFDLLEDALEIVQRLFSGERVSYHGNQVSLRDAQQLPLPVQRPHPPLWVGGNGPRRTLPLVARYADVWHGFGTPSSLKESSERVDELARSAGRDPTTILRAGSLSLSDPWDTVRKYVGKWRDAGWGYLVCGWPDEGAARVEEFAAKVMSKGSAELIVERGLAQRLRSLIRDIPDFPKAGVVFKDITPLLVDVDAFAATVDTLAAPLRDRDITKVLAVEARGFILGAALAPALAAGFVPVRKAGKLPWEVEQAEYVLEYGTDALEVHRDAIAPGERVVIVDDVLATGGTASATVRLARALGGEVVACSFLLELTFLGGRRHLPHLDIHTLLAYD